MFSFFGVGICVKMCIYLAKRHVNWWKYWWEWHTTVAKQKHKIVIIQGLNNRITFFEMSVEIVGSVAHYITSFKHLMFSRVLQKGIFACWDITFSLFFLYCKYVILSCPVKLAKLKHRNNRYVFELYLLNRALFKKKKEGGPINFKNKK